MKIFRQLAIRKKQSVSKKKEVGEIPFFTHPNRLRPKDSVLHSLSSVLLISFASRKKTVLEFHYSKSKKTSISLSSRGFEILDLSDFGSFTFSGVKKNENADFEFTTDDPSVIAKGILEIIAEIDPNTQKKCSFDCYWGGVIDNAEDIQASNQPSFNTLDEFASFVEKEFLLSLPKSFLNFHEKNRSARVRIETALEPQEMRILGELELIETNKAVRYNPSIKEHWKNEWLVVADDECGNFFFVDTNDQDGAIYEADHEELQFKHYQPKALPPVAALDELSQM